MKVHIFSNEDKDNIKEAHDLRNLANHVRSSRIILCGSPGCGKSNVVKNLITNQSPPFDEIYIYHIDTSTKEYDKINGKIVTSTDQLPSIQELDGRKILIIFEDCDFGSQSWSKKDLIYLDKYLRYACTHKGVSVYICCQDYFSVPVSFRRKINVYYLFKSDNATQVLMKRFLPVSKNIINELMEKYLEKDYSNICIDTTHPIPFRHNIFDEIKLK